jgi:hypothetical protein
MLKRYSLKETIPNLMEEEFLLGSQGPDIFFFCRMFPWQKGKGLYKFGSVLHVDKPSALFFEMSRICRDKKQQYYSEVLSYCLGMCCHYCLDRAAHPYVNYSVEKMDALRKRGRAFKYHAEIESMLDVIVLRDIDRKLMSEISLPDCIPLGEHTGEAVAQLYIRLLKVLYSVELPQKTANLLVPDFRYAMGILNDPCRVKRPLAAAVERLLISPRILGDRLTAGSASAYLRPLSEELDYDYANTSHSRWHNPAQREESSNESFFEIFERAMSDAESLILQFLRAANGEDVDFAALTEERTFSYGAAYRSE